MDSDVSVGLFMGLPVSACLLVGFPPEYMLYIADAIDPLVRPVNKILMFGFVTVEAPGSLALWLQYALKTQQSKQQILCMFTK